MLADDVRLDLVSRRKAAGRRDVGIYFGNYDRAGDWRVVPAWLDGREVLVVMADPGDAQPAVPRYFIHIDWQGGCVATIRDFRYVPYITREAAFALAV